MTDNAAKCA